MYISKLTVNFKSMYVPGMFMYLLASAAYCLCHPLNITSEIVLDSTCFFVAEECATFKRCFLLSTANQFSCTKVVVVQASRVMDTLKVVKY